MNTNTFFWILQISKKLKVLSTKLLGGLKFTLMMIMVWFHFLTSQLFINFNRFSPKTMLQWRSIWWLWSVLFVAVGYASIYGELPSFDLTKQRSSDNVPFVPSERPWETIFSGSSHALPPLSKLCSQFLESLLEKQNVLSQWLRISSVMYSCQVLPLSSVKGPIL